MPYSPYNGYGPDLSNPAPLAQRDPVPDCLKNIIGFRFCNSAYNSSKSGLYLDDLHTFSAENIAKYANLEDASTAAELFGKKLRTATVAIKDELLKAIYKVAKFKQNQILEQWKAGFYDKKALFTTYNAPSTGEKRGLMIEKSINSPMTKIMVNRVYISAKQPILNAQIFIDDDATTAVVPVNITGGGKIDTLDLNYVAEGDRVYILFDDSATFETRYSLANTTGPCHCGGCGGCGGGCITKQNNIFVYGWNGVEKTTETWGVGVEVSAYCDTSVLLCSISHLLAEPILLRTAMEMLQERRYSERFNDTVLDKPLSDKIYTELKAEYEAKLDVVALGLPGFLSNYDSCCLLCTGVKLGFQRM